MQDGTRYNRVGCGPIRAFRQNGTIRSIDNIARKGEGTVSVRIGFVGCGGIANAHMGHLEALPELAKPVAFCDLVEERAQKAAERFGAKAYTDYHEMLDKEKLDALYVCVQPGAHEDAEIIAAKKGIHICTEKPVAINMEKAREIAAAIESAGVISSVAYQMRYTPSVAAAKERLAGKTIGMAYGYWNGGMPGVWWWRRMDQCGGQFVEQATHCFDIARYLLGEVDEVYATYATRAMQDVENLTVPDVQMAILKFASGAIASFSDTIIVDQGYGLGLHVVCRNLTVEVNFVEYKATEPGKVDLQNNTNSTYNAMRAEDTAFLTAVKTGDRSLVKSTYADGLKTLQLTLACNQSAATGKPVRVADV